MVNRSQFIALANELYDAEAIASHASMNLGLSAQVHAQMASTACRTKLLKAIEELRNYLVIQNG